MTDKEKIEALGVFLEHLRDSAKNAEAQAMKYADKPCASYHYAAGALNVLEGAAFVVEDILEGRGFTR